MTASDDSSAAERAAADRSAAPLTSVFRDHPLRRQLTNEVHARPPEALAAPMRVSLLAMLSGDDGAEAERLHLTGLCDMVGAPPPPPGATHYSGNFGSFRLKWERHTEFSTWTVFREGAQGEPFTDPAIRAVPRDWVAELPGERLVGVHVLLSDAEQPETSPGMLKHIFGSESYVGSRIAGRAATVWTDFRIHGDGYSRIVLNDHTLTPRQGGRLIQRLLEIETYRMTALLALPVARAILPRVAAVEKQLAELTARTNSLQGLEDERDVLDQLTRLMAEVEELSAANAFRFGAARAYFQLTDKRIAELRETRIEGLQTISEFMERRLSPALSTCNAVESRVDALSRRVARVSALLRTRVEIAVEGQNAELLKSMDRRADLQLRLQETVEGLSVVAISYYLVGIIGYAAKGLKGAGLHIDTDLVTGLMIPLVLWFVWTGVRRIRKVLLEH
jgi:uncharacterized membrane-anchored protein